MTSQCADFMSRILVLQPRERLRDEQPVTLAHPRLSSGVRGPVAEPARRTQCGAEIPVGQVGQVYSSLQGIEIGNTLHRLHAERPQDIEPGNREIGQWVAECGVLLVYNTDEPPVPPEDVSRPVVAVQ